VEKKYVIPATTMITAIVLFIALFVSNLVMHSQQFITISRIASFLIAGLTVYSGYVCRKVGGPKAGNMARFIFLIVYGALAFWQIGTLSSVIFLVMALIPLLLFFAGELKTE